MVTTTSNRQGFSAKNCHFEKRRARTSDLYRNSFSRSTAAAKAVRFKGRMYRRHECLRHRFQTACRDRGLRGYSPPRWIGLAHRKTPPSANNWRKDGAPGRANYSRLIDSSSRKDLISFLSCSFVGSSWVGHCSGSPPILMVCAQSSRSTGHED